MEAGPMEQAPAGTAQALAWFDRLAAAETGDLLGAWRGETWPTGHPLDGALEAFGWDGKRFDSEEQAHPLVFRRGATRFHVHPALVAPALPWLLRLPSLKKGLAAAAVRTLLPLLATRRSRARLRMLRHRGVLTATLVYDDVPIIDVFRQTGDGGLLGLMDCKGMERPFFFLLRRSPQGRGERP